jgi:hypothetical protein
MLLIISCWMLTPVLVQLLGMPPAGAQPGCWPLAAR